MLLTIVEMSKEQCIKVENTIVIDRKNSTKIDNRRYYQYAHKQDTSVDGLDSKSKTSPSIIYPHPRLGLLTHLRSNVRL